MMPKPNLFIVGAPKCGTTAWTQYLSSHPDIFFSTPKELEYFCTDFPRWGVIENESEYLRHFDAAEARKIIAEASVRYLYSAEAADNIKRFNPDARILIFVRDQVDYLPSLHNQMLYNGDETIEDFGEVWHSLKREIPPSCREPAFLDYRAQGRFHEQARRYLTAFGADRVRIFHFDDWTRDPQATYSEILDFLELKTDGRTQFPRINEAARHRFQRLGQFTQSPPSWAVRASALVKRLMGRERPPLVRWIRLLNRTQGYRTKGISDSLAQEIRNYFAKDNRLLEAVISRPVKST